MTNNPHPFKEYSDIITSYQDSSIGAGKFPEANKNIMPPRKCLQCGIPFSSSNLGPYCSPSCTQAHDRGETHKPDSNIMRNFSEVLRQ